MDLYELYLSPKQNNLPMVPLEQLGLHLLHKTDASWEKYIVLKAFHEIPFEGDITLHIHCRIK